MKEKMTIREIEKKDNIMMAQVIREVMPEFGADGPGFAIVDPQVDMMYETYNNDKSIYFVIEIEGQIIGGAGIGPLVGHDDVCELQKMYFLKKARGLGFGQSLMNKCLEFAKQVGYQSCYIETLEGMDQAKGLYLKNGFESLNAPMGNTGHFSCDSWYLRTL